MHSSSPVAEPIAAANAAGAEPVAAAAVNPEVAALLAPSDMFIHRHIGPSDADMAEMLSVIGVESLDALIEQTIPKAIRLKKPLKIGKPRAEHEMLAEMKQLAARNKVYRSLIGQGYHDTITPPVILRNIMENPGWYTQYTPYQAEISQGRLEALLNFQTMISDLTALPVSNGSLLDEGTAAAEAMAMCVGQMGRKSFIVDSRCHPQTIAVVKTRGESMGIEILVTSVEGGLSNVGGSSSDDPQSTVDNRIAGVLVQYPTTDGAILDYGALAEQVHAAGGLFVVAADLLALTLIKPPGEFGADIAVGSAQRFGVPMGFGGPHAGYMSVKNDLVRRMPGRLVGVSKDANGNSAYRLTLQTREQHIRRERATSNICTAQVLLAIMASMYAVYYGPEGLKQIARRIHAHARLLGALLKDAGHTLADEAFFDTLHVELQGLDVQTLRSRAEKARVNLRYFADGTVGVALDELTSLDEVAQVVELFTVSSERPRMAIRGLVDEKVNQLAPELTAPAVANRTSDFLTHTVFNKHHSESELLRYIFHLQGKDLSLVHSMIPLGSCTMKLNATTEMIPVTWPEFGKLHPFAPADQAKGYAQLFKQLEKWLAEITGFDATWLQPNAGSQGEYAGLLMIREYHKSRGDHHRNICIIPTSAHGTNPASAVIAGMTVVPVECRENGDIDLDDLKARAEEHKANLAAVMITYPSTHGVFEEGIKQACKIIHDAGGQVYMDGANMNAQVGLCRPGDIGADVCHLNLHKTFCIPHGGGGPGMGPICMKKHLGAFIPKNAEGRMMNNESNSSFSIHPSALAVSSAPYGSPSILVIPYIYIALMGGEGLKRATQFAILNANYMAARLKEHFPILYAGTSGRCAHEFILDCRHLEKSAGIKVEDIAKRLMDYGFHAPTMSWPVSGTLMVEPTESEPKEELDRLCDALIAIRAEIREIEEGKLDRVDNMLKHAPHTAASVMSDAWSHAYPRERAAFPLPWVRAHKFWPGVGRIDNAYGDRNLVCACPPMSDYQ